MGGIRGVGSREKGWEERGVGGDKGGGGWAVH